MRVWLIPAPGAVKTRAQEIQAAFGGLEWIAPMPEHFFHVTVATTQTLEVEAAAEAWAGVAPFPIEYRRANCFHDAVIVEAHTRGVAALVERGFPNADASLLLPHMSIGYISGREEAAPLRAALEPFRDVDLGTGVADEVLLCDVPVGKSTFLQPWRVVDSVKLLS